MSELADSCPKDKYKFKLRITNNTNTIFLHHYVVGPLWRRDVFIYIAVFIVILAVFSRL